MKNRAFLVSETLHVRDVENQNPQPQQEISFPISKSFKLITMASNKEQIDKALSANDGIFLRNTFCGRNWEVLENTVRSSLASHFIRSFVSLPETVQSIALKDDSLVTALESALAYYGSSHNAIMASSEQYRCAVDNLARKAMFQHFTNVTGEFLRAAKLYSAMRMGGVDDEIEGDFTFAEKCDIYVSMAECYLADDETVEADGAVQRAGLFVDKMQTTDKGKKKEDSDSDGCEEDNNMEWQIILRYKSNYATILDANRKFLQAASRYYEISTIKRKEILQENLLELLGCAATCAILAKSGPQRHQILALISKDERLAQLDSMSQYQNHSVILHKMYKSELLQKKEIQIFEQSLRDHQRAIMSDGMTIMERAVIEHNMIAVSKLFTSILFSKLGPLLLEGVNARKAESVAAKMISDGQLRGHIDQVDGLLTFEEINEEHGLLGWDASIARVCDEFNKISDLLKTGSATIGA